MLFSLINHSSTSIINSTNLWRCGAPVRALRDNVLNGAASAARTHDTAS